LRKRDLPVDRIVVMRVALVAIMLAFLYLVIALGIQAFGGGGARQAKKIERVITEATTSPTVVPAPAPRTDAAKPAAAPP
jgi:hypothetical protein